MPNTVPPEFILATEGLELLQAPPAVVSVNVTEPPIQIGVTPVIAAGVDGTVMILTLFTWK